MAGGRLRFRKLIGCYLHVQRYGLLESLKVIPKQYAASANTLVFPEGFLTPGAWVALTSFAKSKNISANALHLRHEKVSSYASAIKLWKALYGTDDYPHSRLNEGRTYSCLEHLDNPEATDIATQHINGCIRTFIERTLPSEFVAQLFEVVGDLHENVWAHGRASGFSMAQKWKVPHTISDHFLEFALADSGLGFRSEMQRVGQRVESDAKAIEWCVQEGHSTKKAKLDEWAQRVPPDIANNPLRDIAKTLTTDNHHMGLGLFKLIQLVNTFHGKLWIASGDAALVMAPQSNPSYIRLAYPWKGVAIACRFQSSQIKVARTKLAGDDTEIESIMDVLGGRHG